MDTANQSNDIDLNEFFRLISEVRQEETDWKHHVQFVLSKIHLFSELTEQEQHSPIKFRVFGSSAEDLKFCLPNDIGDIDVMVFPVAESSIIENYIIEYVDDFNPIYVRLHGKGHPLLQHCLDENSDFVATSSFKEFHPILFGDRPFLKAIPKFFEKISCLAPESMSTGIVSNPSGPAFQIDLKHSFGNITEQVQQEGQIFDRFSKSDDFRNLMEWFAVSMNPSRAAFTEEHSECIDEYLNMMQEKTQAFKERPDVETFYETLNEVMSSKEVKELKQKVHAIDQKLAEENQYTALSENVTSGHGQGNDTAKVVSNVEKVTDNIDTKLTLPTFYKDLEGKTDASKVETSQDPPEEPTPLPEDKSNETTLKVQKALMQQLMNGIFGESAAFSSDTVEKIMESEDGIQSGVDLVPALKAKGWPTAASAWPSRPGRAWPSQDTITKILDSGFHVVVKTPRNTDQEHQFFRLSFSSAELILSAELNDVQRDCYRCLKILHRFVAKQQDSNITSYFLKNILFWTLEETDVDFWSESNRAACVLMLVERFYKSLEAKRLPHYFVPEYNLLEEAALYHPQEVEHFAGEFKKIYENPKAYSKADLNPKIHKKKSAELPEKVSPNPQGKTVGIDSEKPVEGTASSGNAASAGEGTKLFLKYADFLEIYKEICRELIHLVLEESNHQSDDPTVNTIVENLRKVASKLDDPESELMTILNHNTTGMYSSHVVYPGNSPRQRILEALKSESKMFAYVVAQDDLLEVGKENLIIERMMNSGNFDASSLFANYWDVLKETFRIFDPPPLPLKDGDEIPLD